METWTKHCSKMFAFSSRRRVRAAVRAGLALDPSSTIRRFRDATSAWHDNPTSLAGRDRTIEGIRMAEVPED
jgi:hypothetical protein